jgi:alanyl-tRNA synthetase
VRGGTRLFFVAGGRARRRLAEHERRNRKLRFLLGTSDAQLASALEQKLEQYRRLGRQVRWLEQELAVLVGESLLSEGEVLAEHHFEARPVSFLQQVGRHFSQEAGGHLAFLTASATAGSCEGFFLLAAGADFAGNLPELGRIAGKILQGRGGGSGSLFQGKARRINLRARAAQALWDKLA